MGYCSTIDIERLHIKPDRVDEFIKEYNKIVESEGEDPEWKHYFCDLKPMSFFDERLMKYMVEWNVYEYYGKWYEDQDFAFWISEYAEAGSFLTFNGEDNERWGYMFDGAGGVYQLEYEEVVGAKIK